MSLEQKVIEGILVTNDQHCLHFQIDNKQYYIDFAEIKKIAEGENSLLSMEEKMALLQWFCQQEVKTNDKLEQIWRNQKPIDWSRYGVK